MVHRAREAIDANGGQATLEGDLDKKLQAGRKNLAKILNTDW